MSRVLAAREPDTWIAVAIASPAAEPEGDLAGWVAVRTADEAAAGLQAMGIAAAPVRPVDALGSDPHLVATGFWETMERRYVGLHTLGAPPLRLDGDRPSARCPAPTLGEHTDEVLADWR